jgi:hypothetical protein
MVDSGPLFVGVGLYPINVLPYLLKRVSLIPSHHSSGCATFCNIYITWHGSSSGDMQKLYYVYLLHFLNIMHY